MIYVAYYGDRASIRSAPNLPEGLDLCMVSLRGLLERAEGWAVRRLVVQRVGKRLVHGAALMGGEPEVAVVLCGRRMVHYSFFGRLGHRAPFIEQDGTEIGPCWTEPDYRGRRLYGAAIRAIVDHLSPKYSSFWMICRPDNAPSDRGIRHAGLSPRLRLRRRRSLASLGVHRYEELGGTIPTSEPDTISEASLDAGSERAERDKHIERKRYSASAQGKMRGGDATSLAQWGSAGVEARFRAPYLEYERQLARHVHPGDRVLEVAGGDGLNSAAAALAGGWLVSTDIAGPALGLAARRAAVVGYRVRSVVCDGESLPFCDGTMDVLMCAGGMAFMEMDRFAGEAYRVLRPGGRLILVDSLDHNPIYRLNRFIHYLRGTYSRSVVKRIPNKKRIGGLSTRFDVDSVSYHGIFVFLGPILDLVVGCRTGASLLDAADVAFPRLGRFAFKLVLVARRRGTREEPSRTESDGG